MKLITLISCLLFYVNGFTAPINTIPSFSDSLLRVHRCNDFVVSGRGENPEWEKTNWVGLDKIDTGCSGNRTKFKILYSATGIYVLFSGDDGKISSSFKNDFENLFEADVFEVFFHPNPGEAEPVYFEYEVSPLDKELVLLILNMNGRFGSWMPWHYEDGKKVIKKVIITGGKMEPGASIKSWSAELFFPYSLLIPLKNVPPVPGSLWNANFCRLDYDSGHMVKWSWSPVAKSFHEFRKYHSLLFE